MRMSVRIDGLKDVEARLEKLRSAAAAGEVRAALKAGGEVIASRAKELVPVDTGALRDSIEVQLPSGNAPTAIVGAREPQGFYDNYIEFGTVNMPPQPFLRPAWEEQRDDAQRIVSKHMRGSVKRAADA
ncbi:HK97-gp10 family putative phage morphogenesis protein [Sphingomonas sp. 1P06PA]|uniref:HK97-gp10 family putative phage morphogenesis protein n=1 Tax=Sphingomonas sp. 1P06PA TaxID=554121 RepID=UPI0039A6BD70